MGDLIANLVESRLPYRTRAGLERVRALDGPPAEASALEAEMARDSTRST